MSHPSSVARSACTTSIGTRWPARAWLERVDGTRQPVPLGRWYADAAGADHLVLDACAGATLDVGCGPGRMVEALTRRGLTALGVDVSARAVELTRARGAVALRRDVFDPLPGEGRWRHAMLMDGNLGIGGDPVALLRRLAGLLARNGTVLVETEPPGTGLRADRVRVSCPGRTPGPWFDWARVGAEAIETVAADVGLGLVWVRQHMGRWFAELGRRGTSR